MNEFQQKLIVDLNFPDLESNMKIVGLLHGLVGGFQVGGVPINHGIGIEIVRRLHMLDEFILYDGSFYCTPDTIKPIVRMLCDQGIDVFTVSAFAGKPTIDAALWAKQPGMKLIVVFKLTPVQSSLGDILEDIRDNLLLLWEYGADGLIASARDVKAIRAELGDYPACVVATGVRPLWSTFPNDHSRVSAPSNAVLADYMVVGRPITAHHDPASAVDNILEEIKITMMYPNGITSSC